MRCVRRDYAKNKTRELVSQLLLYDGRNETVASFFEARDSQCSRKTRREYEGKITMVSLGRRVGPEDKNRGYGRGVIYWLVAMGER